MSILFSQNTDQTTIHQVLDKLVSNAPTWQNLKSQTIAIKIHFGEDKCTTFLPPAKIKAICDWLIKQGAKPILIETNVLYKGRRTTTPEHLALAKEHGFDFAPIDILDDGEQSIVYPITNHEYLKEAYFGANLKKYDKIIVASHFKGHALTGYGGAIKNIGMGLASRQGKLAMHADLAPYINPKYCQQCGACVRDCPVQAIDLKQEPPINPNICIGCAHCIAVCPFNAIKVPWQGISGKTITARLLHYAEAVLKQHNWLFLNFAINITPDCDCHNQAQEIITPDIWLFGGIDPVSVDKACFETVNQEKKNLKGDFQLEYAGKIKLGNNKKPKIENIT